MVNRSRETKIKRVNEWANEIKLQSKVAKFYPQAAYTSGFRRKFKYIVWTIPNINHLLQPIEYVIWQKFIKYLFEWRTCNDEERELLSLPVKISLTNITSIPGIKYQTPKKTTKNLVDKIKNQPANSRWSKWLPLYLRPILEWAQKQNNFLRNLINCYVENRMLTTVMLVHELNSK